MRTKNRLQRLIQVRELPLLAFIILLIIFFSITIKGFMTVQNFAMISRQITTVGIVSIGMTLVLVTGGIDLSVGAILSFAINIGGLLIIRGLPIAITYPFILLLGAIMGTINGLLIVWLKVPAIIVTLGTMNIFRGAIMIITRGKYMTQIPDKYLWIGSGYTPFVIFVILLVIFEFTLRRTRFGRNIVAIGSNEQSALYSGVPVNWFKILVYLLSGIFSALAGIIFIGRSGFIQPQAGIGYEMNSIAAVVIGGTSIYGGSGTIIGTFLGSFLMGLILAGITMLAVNAYWQGVINGLLIILAISFDTLRQMRRE
jgi:ribose/xylose/arabinose/galactoside ABC-type transport system permease subunit